MVTLQTETMRRVLLNILLPAVLASQALGGLWMAGNRFKSGDWSWSHFTQTAGFVESYLTIMLAVSMIIIVSAVHQAFNYRKEMGRWPSHAIVVYDTTKVVCFCSLMLVTFMMLYELFSASMTLVKMGFGNAIQHWVSMVSANSAALFAWALAPLLLCLLGSLLTYVENHLDEA